MKKLFLVTAILLLIAIIPALVKSQVSGDSLVSTEGFPTVKPSCCYCYSAVNFLAACLSPIPKDACPTQVCFNGEPNANDWSNWAKQAKEGYPKCPCIFVTPSPLPQGNPDLCPSGEGVRDLISQNCRFINVSSYDDKAGKCVGTSTCTGSDNYCKNRINNQAAYCGRENSYCGCLVPKVITTAIPIPVWPFYPAPQDDNNRLIATTLIATLLVGAAYFVLRKKKK